ncbi:cupin domain-containing protein [Psychromarinibacter sp. C21-152]|uniref:Cupin domain-containing protein n=1 Tax=Psychromarinibacter sediminicola TaxID=3033385 RepID=A0AAE3NNA6_9RHOB|nr:cupin domain-containing protein [Psychromarinibacter sediminicola]MDF0599449.1 cupin domain-containing protein [Psychromarinibacter sediminicola]
MTIPVVNVHDAEGFPSGPEGSDRFGATIAPLTDALGMRGLGAMYVTVEPGRRAFPFHNHLGNDEMFVVLEGEGTYRFGEQEYEVRAGDVCSAPRGGPEAAHQLINTGDRPLKYLGISTLNDPDIMEYPDSGKFAALAIAPGDSFMAAHLKHVGRREDAREYFEGEEL